MCCPRAGLIEDYLLYHVARRGLCSAKIKQYCIREPKAAVFMCANSSRTIKAHVLMTRHLPSKHCNLLRQPT